MISTNLIIKKLRDIGLKSGDAIFIHSKLSGLGEIENIKENDKKEYCKSIYDCFNKVIEIEENKGTLVVPTMTHNYVRKKKPFILEETTSEVGIFTEYVRKMKNSFRTLHPICSVCLRGDFIKEDYINLSSSAYGMNSFFDKFNQIENSKVVFFGADIHRTTYVHHIEHMVGVSYVYNKAYFNPDVIINNKKVDKPFFSSVRYLNKGIEPDYSMLKERLVRKKLINIERINDFEIMVVDTSDLCNEIYSILQENQCSLLKEDYYVTI